MDDLTGYAHPGYASSLAEFGEPRLLAASGASILERPIAGTDRRDAMGCYPLFACPDWSGLEGDLAGLGSELVSLCVIADPFGAYDPALLGRCFPDLVRPFKQHHVIDLSRPGDDFISSHHRRNARRAARSLQVEPCPEPKRFLSEWLELYDHLIDRHGIRGIPAFSPGSFGRQLEVPGIVMLRAVRDGRTVGMLLWYRQGTVGYYHLGAYTHEGYDQKASFALFPFAIDYFRSQGLEWLNLGAGAGATGAGSDGLSRFKQGWATGTRPSYLCGRIFDPGRYREIVQARKVPETTFFPAYRLEEWT